MGQLKFVKFAQQKRLAGIKLVNLPHPLDRNLYLLRQSFSRLVATKTICIQIGFDPQRYSQQFKNWKKNNFC